MWSLWKTLSVFLSLSTHNITMKTMMSKADRIYWMHYRQMQELDTPVAVKNSDILPGIERHKVLVSVII